MAPHAPHAGDEEAVYPGTCREKPHSITRPPAWRFRVEDELVEFEDALHGRCQFHARRQCGDFVVFRNDGIAAYQLATVVDDAFQGVTEVVRGDDLLASTARQLLLYRGLGLTAPQFVHVPLVLDGAGERMAKRRDSTRLSSLRNAGVQATKVIAALAASCGWASVNEQITAEQLIRRFDLGLLPRAPVWIEL
jgi:glutamyl-tRNA synthetase